MNALRIKPAFAIVAAILLSAGAPLPARAQQCGPESVTSFGQWFSPGTTALTADNPTESVVPDENLDAASMKLLLGITAGTDRDFNVVVRDNQYRVLASLGAQDFIESTGLTYRRWTGRLPVSRARVDLVSKPTSDIRVEVLAGVAFAKESSDTRLFSIVRTDGEPWRELHEANTFVMAKRAGDSVGMLVAGATNTDGRKGSWCCSGVMLSSDVMLTNWHCGGSRELDMGDDEYWRSDVCENTIVDLGWVKGALSRQYSCAKVLAHNRRLDIALIRLRPVVGVGGGIGTPVRVKMSESPVASDQDIFVVHHAKCAEKLVSDRCRVRAASYPGWKDDGGSGAQLDFSHDCNTEQGASGAPVFDLNGKLVGLHHLGVKRGPHCNRLDDVNKAVSIREVHRFLRKKHPDLADQLQLN